MNTTGGMLLLIIAARMNKEEVDVRITDEKGRR